jgi:hypothetical protein
MFMAQIVLNQRVGNYKTNKVGTTASVSFKGASGDFRGFLVVLENGTHEIWEETHIVVIPTEPTNPTPA